jgi:dTDP-4-amino-4,6-dideoxygalactose transaminase
MDAAHDIEELFRNRYDREAIYLPSGRLALYLALREWLDPGTRVLMSPINDDVVLFIVLAAGLVPIIGPLDPSTGNLDPRSWRREASLARAHSSTFSSSSRSSITG